MEAKIDLAESVRLQLAQHLSLILADTYVLNMKTQNFLWNVNDARFYSIYLFLKKQIKELAKGISEIAERIRMLGERSPGTLKRLIAMTSLKESDGDINADEMMQELQTDHEILCRYIREQIELARKLRDEGTAQLLAQRLHFHEKSAWMLKSHKIIIPF